MPDIEQQQGQLDEADNWLKAELDKVENEGTEDSKETSQEPQEDTEKQSEVVEDQKDIETHSQASEEPQEEHSDEQDVSDKVANPLKEFDEKFKDVIEAKVDPQVKEYEELSTQVQQLSDAIKQFNPLAGLPQDGIYQYNGKTIYQMTDQELNEYQAILVDSGRQAEAGYIVHNRIKAIENVRQMQYAQQHLTALQTQEEKSRDTIEWQSVQKDFERMLPGTTVEDYNLVAEKIRQKVAADRNYGYKLMTKEGKYQAVATAIAEVGIRDRLVKASSEAKIVETPSAPESRAGSKKVATKSATSDRSTQDVVNMPMSEFSKLSDEEIFKHWGS